MPVGRVRAVLPVLTMESAPAPESVMVRAPVLVILTAELFAPKVKVAGVPEVLSMTTAPVVVAVNPVTVWLVPLRSTVLVSSVSTSGLKVRPPLPKNVKLAPDAIAVVGARLVVKVVDDVIAVMTEPTGTLVPLNRCPTCKPAVDATVIVVPAIGVPAVVGAAGAAVNVVGIALFAVNFSAPRSTSTALLAMFQFDVAPLVPSVKVPFPCLVMPTPLPVVEVNAPLITVSPCPSIVHVRLSVSPFAVMPFIVSVLPAAMLLFVVTLLAPAAKLVGLLKVRV